MLIRMPNIRLDDVPDWVIEVFTRRATRIGMSLPDYVQLVLSRAAAEESSDDEGRPMEEILAEIDEDEPVDVTVEEIVAMIRKTRDA
jgi:hypothetical protein